MGIEIDHKLCTRCGYCVRVCPEDVLHMEDDVSVRYPAECSWCGACQIDCPAGAIHAVFQPGVGPMFLPAKGRCKPDAV